MGTLKPPTIYWQIEENGSDYPDALIDHGVPGKVLVDSQGTLWEVNLDTGQRVQWSDQPSSGMTTIYYDGGVIVPTSSPNVELHKITPTATTLWRAAQDLGSNAEQLTLGPGPTIWGATGSRNTWKLDANGGLLADYNRFASAPEDIDANYFLADFPLATRFRDDGLIYQSVGVYTGGNPKYAGIVVTDESQVIGGGLAPELPVRQLAPEIIPGNFFRDFVFYNDRIYAIEWGIGGPTARLVSFNLDGGDPQIEFEAGGNAPFFSAYALLVTDEGLHVGENGDGRVYLFTAKQPAYVKKFTSSAQALFAGSLSEYGDQDGPASTARFSDLGEVVSTWDGVQRSGLNTGNHFLVVDDQKVKMIHPCEDDLEVFPLPLETFIVATSDVNAFTSKTAFSNSWKAQDINFVSVSIPTDVAFDPVSKTVVIAGGTDLSTSVNASSWTNRLHVQNTDLEISTLCWCSDLNLFIGAGWLGVISTSPDGITWTPRTAEGFASMTDTSWQGSTWSPELSKFVVAGSTKYATSSDGISWSSFSTGFAQNMADVTWSSDLDLFVMVGSSGRLLTSSNGTSWTSRTSNFGSSNIASVVWSSELGLFVVCGASGKIATSPNGTTWTLRTSYTTQFLLDVEWAPELGMFVAVGVEEAVVVSFNGLHWTLRKPDPDLKPGGNSCTIHVVKWLKST